MRFFLAAAGFLGLAEAIPHYQSLQLRDAQSEPCGIAAQQLSLRGSGQIPANIALSCLRSVPLDAEGGTRQLLGLKTVLQFQSTLEFTKDPPSGWVRPATDLIGGLDTLQHRLNASVYNNEYDFQFDLYRLVNSAYDFHLVYTPDIVNVFSFGFGTALYSLSQDGLSLPEVYCGRKDALASSAANSSAVSPLVKIDDRDVQTALNEFAINNTQSGPRRRLQCSLLRGPIRISRLLGRRTGTLQCRSFGPTNFCQWHSHSVTTDGDDK
jgi:hypothetical protein